MHNSVVHPARHSSCGSIPYALAALCNKSHLYISELVLVQILTFPDGSHCAKLLALRNPGAKKGIIYHNKMNIIKDNKTLQIITVNIQYVKSSSDFS